MECTYRCRRNSEQIFSQDEQLRVEVSDNLLDSGAGVRLYDKEGGRELLFTLENGVVNKYECHK